jgi:predicted nuclease with TOPRIM domain
MATPATVDFSFKWAYINTSYKTMQYTSTVNIPIWNYAKLQKIVVTNSINNLLKFVVFDKNRGTNNPAISTVSSLNLQGELFKLENLYASGDIRYDKLYGQAYIKMDYLKIMNSNLEIGWLNYVDRSFIVTYTYDYFEYVTPKSINLPLQFIFNNYNFTASDVTQYKTMGYTADELIKAGLKFSQLLGGYNIMDELFPALCKSYSDIDVEFIAAIDTLKNNTTQLRYENNVLAGENSGLNNECAKLNANNEKLTDEISVLKDENRVLTDENSGLNNECAKLNANNEKLTDEISVLKDENTELAGKNNNLNNQYNTLTTENNSTTNDNTTLNKTNITVNNTNILLKDTNNILKNTNNTLKETNTILHTTNTILTTENNRIRILPSSRWRWAVQQVIKLHNISSG